MSGLLVLLAAQTEQVRAGATWADSVFVYAALALLVGLVWWNGRDYPTPPKG